MPETRDWQEDWKQVEAHRHAKNLFNCPIRKLNTMHGTIDIQNDTERLAYWMQEYKKKSELYDELKEQLARINCDYHSLKNKFLNMREECGAEKKRAAAAEERELKIKDILEEIIYASTYSTYETFEEIGKAKEIYKNIYGETL